MFSYMYPSKSYISFMYLLLTASPMSMNLAVWAFLEVYSSMEKSHHSTSHCWKAALDQIMLQQQGVSTCYIFCSWMFG